MLIFVSLTMLTIAKLWKHSNLTKNISNLIIKQVVFEKRNGVEITVTVLQGV